MSSAAVITIALVALVVLAGIVMLTAARRAEVRGAGALSRETRRRDKDSEIDGPDPLRGRAFESEANQARSAALAPAPAAPEVWVAPDAETVGTTRRQFLNRANVTLMSAGLGGFAAASFIGFLWPFKTAGFGGKVAAGKLDEILAGIRSNSGFLYNATARTWLTEFPTEALPKARAVGEYTRLLPGMERGLVASYQKCPHLGCRVPECKTSQWFECPCHGSQYNRVGEKKGGPAPRGLDHFVVTVADSGDVVIDTGEVIAGPPIGTNTTGQEAEGPHCIGAGGSH